MKAASEREDPEAVSIVATRLHYSRANFWKV